MYNTTKPYTKKILELIKDCKADIPASTDGIGTKGIYHWKYRTFRNAVLDAMAMNLNDMAVLRAKVTGLHNHIILPEEDEEAILEIVGNIARECKRRDIKILSGETAIHNTLSELEISVSVIGEYVQKRENKFERGNSLVGITSSGLHSNGFTKVREIFGETFRNEFIEPTKVYYDAVLDLIRRYDIPGLCHITGGAFTKIKQYLNSNDATISDKHILLPQQIFRDISKVISDEEMYKTFNCGIGFTLSVSPADEKDIIYDLENKGLIASVIGNVTKGNGNVKIDSMFTRNRIV